MDTENVVDVYNGILSSCKRKEILPSVIMLMDLKDIILNEINQTEMTNII